jgi:hypothetical protein
MWPTQITIGCGAGSPTRTTPRVNADLKAVRELLATRLDTHAETEEKVSTRQWMRFYADHQAETGVNTKGVDAARYIEADS